jgi:hypothetical protein
MLTEKRNIAVRSGYELAAHRRRSDDTHHVGVGAQQRVEGIENRAMPGHVAHVDIVTDRRRHFRHCEQPPLPADLHRYRAGPDRIENLPRKIVRHHAAWRGVENERRRVRRREAVVEPVVAEIRDRRNVDQHFGQHHEHDREDEKLAGEPEAQPATAGRFVRRRSVCHGRLSVPRFLAASRSDAAKR